MDTEVTILQSDLLALQVIKALNLDKLPEYGGKPASGPTDNLAPDPLLADSARTSSLLGGFKGGLRVALKYNTRIVEIRYISANPQLAAARLSTSWPKPIPSRTSRRNSSPPCRPRTGYRNSWSTSR